MPRSTGYISFALSLLLAAGCSDTEPTPPPADTGIDAAEGDTGGDAPPSCPGSQTLCDESCVDLDTNANHCGTCNSVCDPTETCSTGTCDCAAPLERCGATCADFQNDEDNCGGCRIACGDGESCVEGTCELVCSGGLTACATGCADTATDVQNCGGCEQACTGGENQIAECVSGTCGRECEPGWYDLDGARGCEYFCDPADPGADICDGQDNDCNGLTDALDPAYQDVLCPQQDGLCAGAFATCVDGALQDCDVDSYELSAGDSPYDVGLETWCDGLDNNCTGGADENCCTDDDLPIIVPIGGIPIGWDHASTSYFLASPINGGPVPLVAGLITGTIDDDAVTASAIIRFPVDGGHGTIVHEWEQFVVGSGAAVPELLAAVWNDNIVAYVRETDDSLHRVELDIDGNIVADEEVAIPAQFDDIDQLRVTPLSTGGEVIMMLTSLSGLDGDIIAFAHVSETGQYDGGGSTGTGATGLVNLVATDEWTVACTRFDAREQALRCYLLDDDLDLVFDWSFATYTEGLSFPSAFVPQPDGGFLQYFAEPSGTGLFALTVAPDGRVSRQASTLGTDQGYGVTGPLPGAVAGLITIPTIVPGDDVEFFVSVPADAGRLILNMDAPSIPLGLGMANDRSYLFIPTRGTNETQRIRMPWAFPLSRDGVALCNDIGE